MIYRLIVIFFITNQISLAQTLEFGLGISKADFSVEDNPRANNRATSNLGLDIFFGLTDIKYKLEDLEDVTGRITIGINKSNGDILSRDGGNGGGSFFSAKIKKTVLTIGAYPANFKLFKDLKMNIGVLYSRLLSDEIRGGISYIGASSNFNNVDFGTLQESILTKDQLSLSVRLSYGVQISEKLSFTPQYMYQVSLRSEFSKYRNDIRMQNHFLGLGLEMKI